jgi:hypothetical protein
MAALRLQKSKKEGERRSQFISSYLLTYGCYPGGACPAGFVAGFCISPPPWHTGCCPGGRLPPGFSQFAGVILAAAGVASDETSITTDSATAAAANATNVVLCSFGIPRATIGAVMMLLLVLLAPMLLQGALAQNPHFVGNTYCDIGNGNLYCTGKVAGLGNISTVTAFIKATVTCTNQTGSDVFHGLVKGTQETLTVRNGQTVFDLTIPNPCPTDTTSVTYRNVALVIDGTTLPIAGSVPVRG